MVDTTEPSSAAEPDDPLVGTRLGKNDRYLLEARLGGGGMGTVYRAWDEEGRRPVAIKVFAKPEADRLDRERFKREAVRFGATLRHPNIVRVFDYRRSRTKPMFIATELIEGRTLADIVDEGGALEVPEAIRIGREVAVGLQFAHRFHVVHRDLKPSNVMIRKADRSVVILDFGIAKDLGSTIGLTRTPGYIGTPGYSAPEQEFGDVDHRADVFSLGALLYELVTGKFAFEGRRLKDLRAAVLNLEPPPAHEVRPEVGAPLSGLIAAMMAKSPRRRPSDMGAVIAALDRIAAGGP